MMILVFLLRSLSLGKATEAFLDEHRSLMFAGDCEASPVLDLSGLGIVEIRPSSFSHCGNVKSVDLSGNWINKIPEGLFSKDMPYLEHLSLANNDLRGESLKSAFRGLFHLKTLNVTHNPLSRILNNENFVGLPNFCEIHIGQSKNFRTITPLAFGRPKMLDRDSDESLKSRDRKSKKCPERLSDRIEMFEVERSWLMFGKGNPERRKLTDEPYTGDTVKMCTDGVTVRLVDFSKVDETPLLNCSWILINDDGTKLKINDETVTSFDRGWYRIRNTSLKAIYLHPKAFENLTTDLLNDLPENIRFFSLQESNLERLKKGMMMNEHLRGLDLSVNFISIIEDGAFAGMNLTRLNLGYNPLMTLDFVTTLPDGLLWLNLEYTGIRHVPENIFSRLKKLLALNLVGSRITELRPPSLDGLVSLQSLDLAIGRIENLRPNVFRDLSQLYYLDTSLNSIERLERGAFKGLDCLAKFDFTVNNLRRLERGSLDGLTDRLEALDLSKNHLENVEAGTFVGAPRFTLSLGGNVIRRIEKGVFDLPYLKYLDLRNNNLTRIDRGAARNLGSLGDGIEIKLGFNPIERLDNGALAGLPSMASVSLAATPMKIIQAGLFDDH